jgi:hypothetical protein
MKTPNPAKPDLGPNLNAILYPTLILKVGRYLRPSVNLTKPHRPKPKNSPNQHP